jgi:hypothetical protein
MDCVVCNQTGGTYRLVAGEGRLGVCEQCVAEHFLDELDDDGCMYCGGSAEYDLFEYVGPLADSDEDGDAATERDLVAEGVVCAGDLDTLRREGL